MSHNWGYSSGKKMAREMGMSGKPEKVVVKAHVRAPRTPKVDIKTAPITPPKPVMKMATGGKVKTVERPSPLGAKRELEAMDDMDRVKSKERAYGFEGMTVGQIIDQKNEHGARRRDLKKQEKDGYSRGGAVKHSDAAKDKKQIRGMVKSDCLKKGK